MQSRPLIHLKNDELYEYFMERQNDIEIIKDIAYEAAFRTYMNKVDRAQIVEHLINSLSISCIS